MGKTLIDNTMNVIEQTVKAENGAIDLHIPVPESLDGYLVKAVIVYEKAEEIEKPKETGMSRFRGVLKYMTPEQHEDADRQLTELRNEWERPIS